MKWKKVSEHPLPEGDGITQYLVKWINGFKIEAVDLISYPERFLNNCYTIEWCEFNPDEIESADSNQEVKNPCSYCGGEIDIRNPTGFCDHLYYPENVNKDLSESNKIFPLEVKHPEKGWIQFGLWALINPEPLFSTRNEILPLLKAGAPVRSVSNLRIDRFVECVFKAVEAGHIKVENITKFACDLDLAIDHLRYESQ